MSTIDPGSKTWIAGLLTALAASICCITPVLALFTGAAGIASVFSWIEPFRPYLIGITAIVLSFAWYQKLKPKQADIACACEDDKPSFWQTRTFLAMVTVLSISLMAFPKYSFIFYPKTEKREMIVGHKSNIHEVKLSIKGMTCQACTETINLALSGVPGVLEYQTEFKDGSSTIKFDYSKISDQAIVNAVNKTGYKVITAKPIQ